MELGPHIHTLYNNSSVCHEIAIISWVQDDGQVSRAGIITTVSRVEV